jgi:GTP-binding protein Era
VASLSDQRCAVVAVLGAPNAGKSTLVNQLAGAKVSIVTHKAQTTRARLRAIVMEGNTQLIVVDTPGIFAPKRNLDRAMVDSAWLGAAEADAAVLLADAREEPGEQVSAIIRRLREIKPDVMLALNKIDLVKRDALLERASAYNGLFPFQATFMISALNGSGVADLRRAIAQRMPEGPWLYPPDQTADVQLRFLASEITREKLFLRLHDELPYASTVETESWEDRKDGSAAIRQVIYVARDSQKKIVLGHKGGTIKQIGQQSRLDMEREFGRRIHLFLFVKVREKWAEDPERLRMMGLEG